MWCQILINYDPNETLTLEDKHKAGEICRNIIRSLRFMTKRSFYLYELFLKDPHLFIAVEISPIYQKLLRLYFYFIRFWMKGGKIAEITLRENTKDSNNGELFLDILSGWCNSLADNYDKVLMQQPGREKGLKQLHHILHCVINASLGNRKFEVEVYKKMFQWYGRKPLSTLKKKK